MTAYFHMSNARLYLRPNWLGSAINHSLKIRKYKMLDKEMQILHETSMKSLIRGFNLRH